MAQPSNESIASQTANVNVQVPTITGSFSHHAPRLPKLYRLRGDDRTVLERRVALTFQHQEVTAFRFTLDASGEMIAHNRLSKVLAPVYGWSRG